MVLDMNGTEIVAGQTVIVHQEEEVRYALVIDVFPDSPTCNAPGYWVDININNEGIEGMMSYILEVNPS